MIYPNLKEEKQLWNRGYKLVVGLDESGRGGWAGPVVAAALMIKPKISTSKNSRIFTNKLPEIREVRDSKKLTPKTREKLYKVLTKHFQIEWGIGIVSEKIIDKINIQKATELAMEKAIKSLKSKPDFLIIDGNKFNSKKLQATSYKLIVRADEKVFSCSAASIIAKVTRDRIMQKLDKKYPQYGFKYHKGYGTKLHFEMLEKYGPCKIHRKTFQPIKKI